MTYSAAKLLSLIDLTSLSLQDTDESIRALCQKADTPLGQVAAVCVYPKFLPLVTRILAPAMISVAVVVNFPEGKDSLSKVRADIALAVERGAQELDVVIPYHEIKKGNSDHVISFIRECKASCGLRVLKTILETGALTASEIKKAAELALEGGADFLKTSTGKLAVGATCEAAEILLSAISKHQAATGHVVGFKASGGVKTVESASQYLDLAKGYLGEAYLSAKTFRIGASSLVDVVLASDE